MKKKVLIIINPKAGKGKIQKKIPEILKNFPKDKYETKICYTRLDYMPEKIIEENKNNIDLIISCGGDGTLNEVINAVMKLETRPNIGLIPLGTMNDFAKTIGLPKTKMLILEDIDVDKYNLVSSDIGEFNDRYFNYVAAFGAFTDVSYTTSNSLKKVFGRLAYFIVAVKYIPKIRSHKIKLEADGKEIEDKFIYGSISNSKSVAGFKWFKKGEVKVDDGKFEMLLVKSPKNVFQFIDILISILSKNYKEKLFYYFQTDKIVLQIDDDIPWTIDGEYGGKIKDVKIKNNTKQIDYIVPISREF